MKASANRIVELSRDASYSRSYLVSLEQEAAAASGGHLTERQAENKINREQSARVCCQN